VTENERVAVVETKSNEHDRRIAALEANQKWGVMAILSLVAKMAFDFVTKGQGQ